MSNCWILIWRFLGVYFALQGKVPYDLAM